MAQPSIVIPEAPYHNVVKDIGKLYMVPLPLTLVVITIIPLLMSYSNITLFC